ncbi:hypothetical protein ACQKCU_17265 [Heyndrickxia sporothermodurans]
MSISLYKNQKIIWLISFISIILIANFSLYRIELNEPITPLVTIGSLLDFIVVIPLLVYFLFLRKQYSKKYLFAVIASSYGIAWLIIPSTYWQSISFTKYFIFMIEGCFILIEVYLATLIIRKIPLIRQKYKESRYTIPFFLNRLDFAVHSLIKPSLFSKIVISEFSIFYYSLFSWRKKSSLTNFEAFSYHQKTSSIALNIMFIHGLVIESIGFHYLLHNWNPTIAIIALIFNLYGLFILIADIQAIRLCPFLLSDDILILNTGIMKRINIPIKNIKEINEYPKELQLKKQNLVTTFDASPPDFIKEKPNFEIILKEPIAASFLYGKQKKVKKVILNVDNPQRFFESLTKKHEKVRI